MQATPLNCPNCGASLNVSPGDTAIECSYCGSDLRISPSGEASLFFSREPGQPSGPTGVNMAEIRQLIRDGKKINAIKRVREQTNWGLKEAKDFVDALEVGKPLPLQPRSPDLPRPIERYDAPNWEPIRQQLAAGRKIEAIKIYREQTGVGLKEAKEAVEMFERGEIPPPPSILASQPAVPGHVNLDEIRQLLAAGNKIEAVKRYREQTGKSLKESLEVIDAMPEAQAAAGGQARGGCARVLLAIVGFIVLILGGCGFAIQRGDLYQCAIYDITHDREVVQALGEPIQTYPIVFVLGYESSSDFFGNSNVEYGALTYINGANAGSLVQISASHSTGFPYHAIGDLRPDRQKIRVLTSGDIETCRN